MRGHLAGGALDGHLTDAHRRTVEQRAGSKCLKALICASNHRARQRQDSAYPHRQVKSVTVGETA